MLYVGNVPLAPVVKKAVIWIGEIQIMYDDITTQIKAKASSRKTGDRRGVH